MTQIKLPSVQVIIRYIEISSIAYNKSNFIEKTVSFKKIRLYDLKSGMRRPVVNMNYGEFPITSIAVCPNETK